MTKECCARIKELLQVEMPDLKDEIETHKYFLNMKSSQAIGDKEAEIDYIQKYIEQWGSGEKFAYCTFMCPEKDCSSRSQMVDKLRKNVEQYRIKLVSEEGKNFSFEEARRKYLSLRGPSFWKGIAGVVFNLMLDKEKMINNFVLK